MGEGGRVLACVRSCAVAIIVCGAVRRRLCERRRGEPTMRAGEGTCTTCTHQASAGFVGPADLRRKRTMRLPAGVCVRARACVCAASDYAGCAHKGVASGRCAPRERAGRAHTEPPSISLADLRRKRTMLPARPDSRRVQASGLTSRTSRPIPNHTMIQPAVDWPG